MIEKVLDNLLKLLPHNYTDDKDSNLGKLIEIFTEEFREINNKKDYLKAMQDIDKAENSYLDLLGDSIGQKRGSYQDYKYRLLIKSRIKQNLSGGDIPTVDEFFKLILGNNYLGIKEGWDSLEYENEPALVIFRYIHEIIEGGIKPVESIKLDGSTNLNGDYLLTGKKDGYFESEIINFAKSLAKRVIAAGVRILWEAEIIAQTKINIEHKVNFELNKTIDTREVKKLDGNYLLNSSLMLDANKTFVHNETLVDINQTANSNTNAFLNSSLKLDGSAKLDGKKDAINQSGALQIFNNSNLIEEVAI